MGHIANLRQAVRRDKTIQDPLLNRLGLQVGRTIAAHAIARVRRWDGPDDPVVAGWVDTLRRDGCVEIPDFLDPADLTLVADAARDCLARDVRRDEMDQGGNHLELIWRDDVPQARRADLDRFFLHPGVLALASAAERILVEPGAGRCHVQHLVQRKGEPDIQAAIHSDTFHPTHKVWLYLTDVSEDDGPLVYYPGSHRLGISTLRAIYRESNAENAGSRRLDEAEVARRGLAARSFTCPANTLVVADTCGYHGRVQGRPPGSRTALHMELRPPPFRRSRRLRADHPVSAASRRAAVG